MTKKENIVLPLGGMHVENRVNRAHMLAQEVIQNMNRMMSMEGEDMITLHILLAELINAIQGLNYKGEPLS